MFLYHKQIFNISIFLFLHLNNQHFLLSFLSTPFSFFFTSYFFCKMPIYKNDSRLIASTTLCNSNKRTNKSILKSVALGGTTTNGISIGRGYSRMLLRKPRPTMNNAVKIQKRERAIVTTPLVNKSATSNTKRMKIQKQPEQGQGQQQEPVIIIKKNKKVIDPTPKDIDTILFQKACLLLKKKVFSLCLYRVCVMWCDTNR